MDDLLQSGHPGSLGAGGGGRPPPVLSRVAVQQRKRLFREGISQLLAAEHDVEVVAMATTDADLAAACRLHRPVVAVIEVNADESDALRMAAAARRALPSVAVIGLTAEPPTTQELTKARRGGVRDLVARQAGIAGILSAVRTAAGPSTGARVASIRRSVPASSSSLPTMLTSRELEVLSLVGAGLTSVAVSGRLSISHKTVENHKQRIFAKLGVQNQAHAVSVAMRTGLMRPERVIDLAVAE